MGAPPSAINQKNHKSWVGKTVSLRGTKYIVLSTHLTGRHKVVMKRTDDTCQKVNRSFKEFNQAIDK